MARHTCFRDMRAYAHCGFDSHRWHCWEVTSGFATTSGRWRVFFARRARLKYRVLPRRACEYRTSSSRDRRSRGVILHFISGSTVAMLQPSLTRCSSVGRALASGARGRGSESHHLDSLIPVAQWIAHQIADLAVTGSTPVGDVFYAGVAKLAARAGLRIRWW